MPDRPAVEVFDGDGPSETVFVERTVDLLCETCPDIAKKADRVWLEARARDLIDNCRTAIKFQAQREGLTGADGLGGGAENVINCVECGSTGMIPGSDGDDAVRCQACTEDCSDCKGTGSVRGSTPKSTKRCKSCKGTGTKHTQPFTSADKRFIQCGQCGGSGQGSSGSHSCPRCEGAGKVELKPTLMDEIRADNAAADLELRRELDR